jgi:hypothetical protein
LTCHSQTFSVFKSYKDAKIKPKNYAKTNQRTFPEEDYLDETQKSMLRKRRAKSPEAADTMTNQWSGFEVNKKLRKRGTLKGSVPIYDRPSSEGRRLTEKESVSEVNSNWYSSLMNLLCFDQLRSSPDPFSKGYEFLHFRRGIYITIGIIVTAILLSAFVLFYFAATLYCSKNLDELQLSSDLQRKNDSETLLRNLSIDSRST